MRSGLIELGFLACVGSRWCEVPKWAARRSLPAEPPAATGATSSATSLGEPMGLTKRIGRGSSVRRTKRTAPGRRSFQRRSTPGRIPNRERSVTSPHADRRARWLPSLGDVLAARALLALAFLPILSEDLWLHWAIGRAMRAFGGIPRVHPLDLGSGARSEPVGADLASWAWEPHEWLFQWGGAFALDLVAGVWPAVLLRALAAALVAGLFWAIARRRGASTLVAVGLTLIAFQAVSPALAERPGLATAVGIPLVLWGIERRRVVWLIPVFLLWANLHAGVIAGLGILVALAPRSQWRWVWLCLLGTCIAPRGPAGLWEPLLEVAKAPVALLDEWRPPDFKGVWGVCCALLSSLGLVAAFRGATPIRAVMVFLISLAAFLHAQRHVVLFAPIALWLLAGVAGHSGWLWRPALEEVVSRARGRYLTPIAALVAAWSLVGGGERLESWEASRFPREIVGVLRDGPEMPGPIFADYRWGGYLVCRLGERVQVFVDGSMRQGPEALEYYLAVHRGEQKPPPGYRVLTSPGSPLASRLLGEGWEVEEAEPSGVLLGQRGSGSGEIPRMDLGAQDDKSRAIIP